MKFLATTKKPWLIFALSCFILLGSFLRLYRIETKMRFIWDEGRDMIAIRQIVADKNLTLLGPFNEQDGRKDFFGVFHYYLMAPALWATNYDPLGPAILTASLGILSIGLVYLLVKEWESPLMALVVTGLYAVNPLVIKYVQWPWNPNTVPFFALLYGLAITKLHQQHRWRWSVLAGLLLGLLFQLHYFTIALVSWWLLVIFNKKFTRNQRLLQLGSFSLSWLLPNLTFVIFDLKNQGFLSHILKDSFLQGGNQQLFQFNLAGIISYSWQYLVQLTANLFATDLQLAGVITASWLIALIYFNWLSWQQKKLSLINLISLSWLMFLAITAFFPTTPDDYHSSYLWFGVLLIILKALVKLLYTRFDVWLLTLSYLLLGSYLIKANEIKRAPQWSENMPAVREISHLISEDVNQFQVQDFNVVDLSTSDSKATRYRYFLINNHTQPLHQDKYPEATVLYAITQQPLTSRLEEPIWELASFAETEQIKLGVVDRLQVYKLVKQP